MWELYQKLNRSFQSLTGQSFSVEDFRIVWHSMSGSNRFYHGKTHLRKMTEVSKADGKILTNLPISNPQKMIHLIQLAGFFHDAVYVTVDKGVTPEIQESLGSLVTQTPQGWRLNPSWLTGGIKTVFGVPESDVLPPSCQNEALSALLAGQMLWKNGLGRLDILSVFSMIEATVPFQPHAAISQKTAVAPNIFGKQTQETVYGGIYLGNKDVNGFGDLETPFVTLKKKLLSNALLVGQELFPGLRPKEPSHADKELGAAHNVRFWNYLLENDRYRQIFHQYQNYPLAGQMKKLTYRAEKLIRHGLKTHTAELNRLTGSNSR